MGITWRVFVVGWLTYAVQASWGSIPESYGASSGAINADTSRIPHPPSPLPASSVRMLALPDLNNRNFINHGSSYRLQLWTLKTLSYMFILTS